jgi:hypothetical protein
MASAAAGILDLLKVCFAKIPAGARPVIVRADKGFYDHGLVEWLEACQAAFVIVARLTGHLRYTSQSRGLESPLPDAACATPWDVENLYRLVRRMFLGQPRFELGQAVLCLLVQFSMGSADRRQPCL